MRAVGVSGLTADKSTPTCHPRAVSCLEIDRGARRARRPRRVDDDRSVAAFGAVCGAAEAVPVGRTRRAVFRRGSVLVLAGIAALAPVLAVADLVPCRARRAIGGAAAAPHAAGQLLQSSAATLALCLPAAQLSHAAWFSFTAFPASHVAHAPAPVALYESAGHAAHRSATSSTAASSYLPASHALQSVRAGFVTEPGPHAAHAVLPSPPAYVSLSHALHVPPVPAWPASHDTHPVLSAFTSVPLLHVEHSELPRPLEYVMPLHARHAAPPELASPAAHALQPCLLYTSDAADE